MGEDLEEQEMFNPSFARPKKQAAFGHSHLIHLVATSTGSQDSTIGDLHQSHGNQQMVCLNQVFRQWESEESWKNKDFLLKGPLQVCHSLWVMSWYLIDITSSADDVFPSDHSTKKTRYHYGGREIPHNYGELPKVVHSCLFHGWNWYRRKTRFYAIAEVSLVFLKKSASTIHTLRQINN